MLNVVNLLLTTLHLKICFPGKLTYINLSMVWSNFFYMMFVYILSPLFPWQSEMFVILAYALYQPRVRFKCYRSLFLFCHWSVNVIQGVFCWLESLKFHVVKFTEFVLWFMFLKFCFRRASPDHKGISLHLILLTLFLLFSLNFLYSGL